MKDDRNLEGQIVGYDIPYQLHPSQVEPGEPLDAIRTSWARVEGGESERLWCICMFTGQIVNVDRSTVHTVMPVGYPNLEKEPAHVNL